MDNFNKNFDNGNQSPEERFRRQEELDKIELVRLSLVQTADLQRYLKETEDRLAALKAEDPELTTLIDRRERDIELIKNEIKIRESQQNN